MKQLLNHPFLLALILSVPLWMLLGNYIVAFIAALLVAFLLSMVRALRVLNRKKAAERRSGQSSEDIE
ncbi:hypothetical protein VRY85_01615 [Achromobacter sp. F4_2707]|uniref:hypothetical protein n=1 Tax=Achromobacter sp. F4_2707 TaxID=3114286 RepID=UPI0039C6161C